MKYWLLVVFLLLVPRVHAQPAWPVNPQSKQVEWVGRLPWPTTARTPPQRQALAQRWFRTKLAPAAPVPAAAVLPRTYAGVPRRVHLLFEQGDAPVQLRYEVTLSASPAGLRYVLTDFRYAWSQGDAGGVFPLAMVLDNPTVNREALAFFHRHLVDALAGW